MDILGTSINRNQEKIRIRKEEIASIKGLGDIIKLRN
jgi:hypothetical protein